MTGVLDEDFWTGEQEDVVTHQDGPLQVIACAGSGKTHTVSGRIAQLISQGVNRENIVAFTFTENAAEELQINIREWLERANLDDDSLGRMSVSTIHSFCGDLLKKYNQAYIDYDVLEDNARSAFITRHFFDLGLHHLPPRHPDRSYQRIEWFIDDIDTMRREMIVNEVRASNEETAQQLFHAYNEYQNLMDELHFFDYQELIYRAVTLLENDQGVLEEVRDDYQYLIVDEYQDVNPVQERLIQLLAGDECNLCVVGDDDQSIYEWRGARPGNFLTFTDRYDEANSESLSRNFRSTELIIDIAQGTIQNNTERIPKEMNTERDYDVGDVYQLYFDHENEEVEFIADRIEELEGVVYEGPDGNDYTLGYGDIALLFRRKRDMEFYQNALTDRQIPFTVRGNRSMFGRPETAFVREAFAYIARGQHDDIEVIDVVNSPPPNQANQDDPLQYHNINEEDLHATIAASQYLRGRGDQIIAGVEELRRELEDPDSRRLEPQSLYHQLLSIMGISQLHADDGEDAFPEPIMYELGRISKLIRDFETVYEVLFPAQIEDLVDFFDYSYYFADSGVEDTTLVDAVNMMTIHSAKGTEYPAVFVPSLTSLKMPAGQTAPRDFRRPHYYEYIPQDVFNYANYESDEEAYRRLFYVAVTRAQKFLHLTGAKNNVGYQRRQNPSQYYEEVEALNHPGIVTENVPDPAPRRWDDVGRQQEGFTYPTSFSDIRYYQKCAYDYKLRKIFDFEPGINPRFGFGFAIHDILRKMHERFGGETISIPVTEEELQEWVWDPDEFHLRYARGEIDTNLRQGAEAILQTYLTEYSDNMRYAFRAEEPFETLITDDTTDASALVSGEIDLLERHDPETGELREVNVIDFKTSDEPDEDDYRLRDDRYQVRLYALATQSELDLNAVDGHIHYLDDEDPSRREVDVSDRMVNQVEMNIANQVKYIMQREFTATPDEEICARCDFNNICPHSDSRE